MNVKLFDPFGQPVSCFDKVLYLENGKGFYEIPIAINAPKGKWKICAFEVLSGKKSELQFNVK